MSKHNIFFIKSIIFALIICFIGTLFPMTTTINAHEKVDRDYEISADSDSDNPRLDKCNILKYVDDQAFLSNGFVKRIPEDEDLNSYVFEREDGSRNLYMFSEDVKFETSDGTVLEKDISLQRYSNGYVTKQNNIHLFLPDHYTDGVRLSFENEELVFLPLSSNSDTIAYDYIDKISYQGAFGCNTELVYTPTLSGVKQDIVLNDYEGVNRFCYVVHSETLKPFTEDSCIFFADSYNAEYRFVLGSVYIYDSEGRFTSGELDVEQIGNNEWIITITAPMAFLESEATVFPVTIDPTISVQASISSAYIEDVAILSGLGNTATGAWSTVYTGFLSEATGISRTLVRLPGLINNSTYSSIPSALITSAKFCVYEQTTAGTGTVSLYNYVGTSWTENGATWNNVSYNGYSSLFDTQTPVGGTLVEFNITNLVKGWKNGTYSSASGFMLRKQNEGDGVNYHTFYSSESSYSSYRPYVEVSYTPILINLTKTAIDEGESMPLFATIPSGATLSWSNSGNNPNISVDSGGIVTGLKACTSPCTITATIVFQGNSYSATAQVYVKIPDGTYFLKNKSSGRFADATGYSNGDEVLRWSFHGANNQRWEISYISNGLYSIKNKMSNKYLGVEAINSTTAITRQYTSLGDSTKWYIAKTSSGAYRLYAKGNLTYGYVIGSSPNSNTTIVNMTYTNNSDYKDEWIVENVQSFVYKSYNARIYYDSSISISSTEINTIYDNATASFVSYFNLEFSRSSTAYSSSLNCDSSCHATSSTSICTSKCAALASCNSAHHRGASRLINELTSNSYYTYRLVGYALCYYDGTHDEVVGLGNVNGKNAISSYITSPDITRSIQHELTHNLGGTHNDCTTGQQCVLKGNFNCWCDHCKQCIKNNY